MAYTDRSLRGDTMKVGDLVKNVHSKEVGLITVRREGDNYVVISGKRMVHVDHLEVINEAG